MINFPGHSYAAAPIYNPGCIPLNIGKYTSIAGGLHIVTASHPRTTVSNYPFKEKRGWNYPECIYKGPVNIGSDVWLCSNVSIVDDVTIGDGAIVGAFAVVSKDIPPYAIAVGNPIRVIKYRFTPEQIEALLKIKWWDWDDAKINASAPDFTNINNFIKKYGPVNPDTKP